MRYASAANDAYERARRRADVVIVIERERHMLPCYARLCHGAAPVDAAIICFAT